MPYELKIVEKVTSNGYHGNNDTEQTVLSVAVPQPVLLALITLITTKLDEAAKVAAPTAGQ